MAHEKQITLRGYYMKSTKWYFYNLLLGLAALILIKFFAYITDSNFGEHTFNNLLYREAVPLFVTATLMGTITIDFWMNNYNPGKYWGLFIYGVPIAFLLVLTIQYCYIHENPENTSKVFDSNSYGSWFKIALSLLYCIVAKSSLYLREERREKEFLLKTTD